MVQQNHSHTVEQKSDDIGLVCGESGRVLFGDYFVGTSKIFGHSCQKRWIVREPVLHPVKTIIFLGIQGIIIPYNKKCTQYYYSSYCATTPYTQEPQKTYHTSFFFRQICSWTQSCESIQNILWLPYQARLSHSCTPMCIFLRIEFVVEQPLMSPEVSTDRRNTAWAYVCSSLLYL